MHSAREMYRDVTDIKTVEVADEFFNRSFIRHLVLGAGEKSRRNEHMNALHWNYANSALTVLDTWVTGVFASMGP